jgi:inorganic pyrophosphatase
MKAIDKLPTLANSGVLNAVIETPAGSTSKLKWDPEIGLFVWSRPLPLGVVYPHDFGFIAGTRADDGDPLDVLVLSEGTTFPGVVVRARPIGVVRLEQNSKEHESKRERNDRLIAVPDNAPRRDVRDANDLSERVIQEIERFFLDTTYFESKDAEILGWGGPDEAWQLVEQSSRKQHLGKKSA